MQYLTRVMRGEEHEFEMINVGNFEQQLVEVPVKHKDRIKSAELLGKRYGSWTDRVDVNANVNNGQLDSILEQLVDPDG